eukprot:1018259_1
MSSQEKLLFQRFLKAEALFKTDDGLLIAQPDVSRQQYYNIEYDNGDRDSSVSYHPNHKRMHRYQERDSTTNINTAILPQLWNDDQSLYELESTDDDSSLSSEDDDDDDDVDWNCCAHHISFLNDYDNDVKISDDGPTHTPNRSKLRASAHHKSNTGLDSFLSDILEETYHKKRNEAILLSMQRQNKSHIHTQNSKQLRKTQNHNTSSFSSSHHTKLCQRCCHIFLNPKARLNQILQLYHVERRLKSKPIDMEELKHEHSIPDWDQIEGREISHAIFHPSITSKLFDFTHKGHDQYTYKYIRKHMNLPNLFQILSTKHGHRKHCIISDHSLITLSTINRFNRAILGSQYRKLFIMYQLLQLFAFMHNEYNIVHGNLSPSLICINPHNLLITVTGWFTNHYNDKFKQNLMNRRASIDATDYSTEQTNVNKPEAVEDTKYIDMEELLDRTNIPKTPWNKPHHEMETVDTGDELNKYKQRIVSQSELLRSVIYRWIHREISNFEYVMELNNLCGRMKGDPFNHPVLPWVVDFTSSDGIHHIGWRDLSKSKFRLNKGDHQIDYTFLNSPQPHHVTEVLSSLTYFLYLARRTPRYILQKAVRSRFEPKEFPISMAKLYQCSPEECIPEFYCDSTIFESIIDALPNLQIPPWCHSPSHFIQWHRRQLESKQVSENLHLWIDLNFGYRLGQDTLNNDNKYIFGYNESIPCTSRIEAAIDCKNIPLQFDPLLARHCGVIQLFNQPHPPQIGPHNKIYNPWLDNNYLSHQQSMQIQRRIVEFGTEFLKLYSCTISPESLGFMLSDKDNTLSIHRQNNNIVNIMSSNTDKISNMRQKGSKHQRSPTLKNARAKSWNTEEKKTDDIPTEITDNSNEDMDQEELKSIKAIAAGYSPARHSLSALHSDKMRSKSQQITRRRSKKTSTSPNDPGSSQNMSYFAYDASGHGYVGYLNEDSRKRVGVVSPLGHYANYKDDIFSLGCIMAEIFTGKPLFCYNALKKHLLGNDVLSGSLCKLPPVVSSCIKAMVNRDPSLRPNINEVLKWDSLFVYGMKEMYDLIQYIHEWLSQTKLMECMERNDRSISIKYIDLLIYITSSLKMFPEMHPELFALITPYLIEDIPIWSDLNESLLHYFKMVWCISSKLSEELCCYLLKKPFLSLLSLCQRSHALMMELLKPNTANFIRNHFGEYNFSKYYMKTIRSSLKSNNTQIRKTAEIFLISMNKFMELNMIENSIIDPILNDLNNNVSLNPQEIRSFMMITQSRGEIFITKHVIPKMLNIINDKIATKIQQQSPLSTSSNTQSLYVIFAILELLIYLLKPHRTRKFVLRTGLTFTDNTAIFKCLRLPLNGKYFNLIEFKKLILLVIRIAQFFGPKSEITQSLLKTLEPMMIKLKERVGDPQCVSFNVYTSNDCRELLFMIYTSFQSIFSEKQLDAELDQIELKSSKEIKSIVLYYMGQRRSINNTKKDKKQTVSLKDHSPPILEPSTWKINVHSSFYQQIIKNKQVKEQEQEILISPSSNSNVLKSDELKQSDDDEGMERDRETDNETDNDESTTDDEDEAQQQQQRETPPPHSSPKRDKQWQFKANIHHIIQGHQPSTRILTIESKKNANLVLTGGSEGNIRMWRVEYSKLRDLTQYTQHLGAIKNISFLKYTDQIASCCGEIHVWDSAKCETIRKFTPHASSSLSSKPPRSKPPRSPRPAHHPHAQSMNLDMHAHSILEDSMTHHNKIFDKYTCMTPFNYCCLLAGNQKGRIEFLDINTRSCSYDWEILPHSKLNLSKIDKIDNAMSVSSAVSSSSIRRVTAISVRSNQREVAVGLSDGQIVILDLRNGFIVESFHEFNSEITKLYWCCDNILIALCRDEGLYVFNCNQISRLYLKSCSKFKQYRKEKLYVMDEANHTGSNNKKSKKSNKFVSIGNGDRDHDKDNTELFFENKSKLHQQISKKLIEIGDASNDITTHNDGAAGETNGETNGEDWHEIHHPRRRKDDSILFNHDEYFNSVILSKDHELRKRDVVIRTLLLNPNFNGDIDDYSRYTEHIRAYHSYINRNNSMASNGMQQVMSNSMNPIVIDADVVRSMNPEIDENCNNLLPFTPIITKPFLFNSTPEIIARYNPSRFDPKSLKTIKTNLSQYKITDFGLYKSNIICSIGKGIGYAKLKTPIQVLKEPNVFTQQHSHQSHKFAKIYNSKMITRSFPSLKTKSSLSSLSILENMHLVIIGTNNGKVFTCG